MTHDITVPATVDHLFQDKVPEVKKLYLQLIEELGAFGPVRVAPKKTSVHIEKNSGFAGVHPRKGYFNVEFRTDYKINDPRIVRQQQLSARRFEHTVKIEKAGDIDQQLLKWLRDTYDLSK
jgi:Domain of unknown function (DUF5655)